MKACRAFAARAALGLIGLCLMARPAAAADATGAPFPVALAVVPSLEAPGPDRDIVGLRLNLLAGLHRNVSFLDMGVLADLVEQDSYGVTVAGLWNSTGSARGALQAAGVINLCHGDCYGLQAAGIHSRTEGVFIGLQAAALCFAETSKGLQAGAINRTGTLEGVQVGLSKFAERSTGIQLGLVNVMPDGRYPVMPVFNLGF